MEKSNFKKMALMGIAGGMLLASQSISADNVGSTGTFLASGCSGKGGCSNSYQPTQSCGHKRGYTADATSEIQGQTQMRSKPLTESELLSELNEQGKATYQSLTPEGRALALTLANQGTPADKNEAVKLAAQKMSEKRSNGATRSTSTGY